MASDVLHDSRVGRMVELALMEDIGMGDVTGEATLTDTLFARGHILCKDDGIVAGLEVAALVFQYCDHSITLKPLVSEGAQVHRGTIVAHIDGLAKAILRGERTALNFLQRMSGIATLTHRFVERVQGTGVRITDTRKTAPGLRVLDKWAVQLGGGINHRFGLDDMVLIKDNHIAAAGGIINAVNRCRSYLELHGLNMNIEVETKTPGDVMTALTCSGITRIMLDNFSLDDMRRAVELINHRVEVEASGGITLDNVREVALTGVDLISVGSLTHSVQALDFSLDISQVSDS